MKKKLLCLLSISLLLSGCGKIPTLQDGKEAVVTFDDDAISVDELYEEVKDTYALSTLIKLIDTKVLEKEFKSYINDANESAQSNIDAIRENYDSEEELLSDIQTYTGYSTIEAYQDYLYLNYMQSHAIEEYAKDQITEKQIKSYYKTDTVGDIEVSHILITPDIDDSMSDDEKEEAETKAYSKAKNLLEKLQDAENLTETFATLAKENSDDDSTKDNGGALGKINKSTLGDDYSEFTDAAYSIKDGELYGKVVTTELGYHIILRTASYDKPELDDVKDEIIETLAEELMSSDSTISIEALQYYRKKHDVEIQDSELQTQYAYYIQNLISSASEEE